MTGYAERDYPPDFAQQEEVLKRNRRVYFKDGVDADVLLAVQGMAYTDACWLCVWHTWPSLRHLAVWEHRMPGGDWQPGPGDFHTGDCFIPAGEAS